VLEVRPEAELLPDDDQELAEQQADDVREIQGRVVDRPGTSIALRVAGTSRAPTEVGARHRRRPGARCARPHRRPRRPVVGHPRLRRAHARRLPAADPHPRGHGRRRPARGMGRPAQPACQRPRETADGPAAYRARRVQDPARGCRRHTVPAARGLFPGLGDRGRRVRHRVARRRQRPPLPVRRGRLRVDVARPGHPLPAARGRVAGRATARDHARLARRRRREIRRPGRHPRRRRDPQRAPAPRPRTAQQGVQGRVAPPLSSRHRPRWQGLPHSAGTAAGRHRRDDQPEEETAGPQPCPVAHRGVADRAQGPARRTRPVGRRSGVPHQASRAVAARSARVHVRLLQGCPGRGGHPRHERSSAAFSRRTTRSPG
jgi:hypothetical protein